MTDLLTVNQVAERYHITRDQVFYALKRNLIKAQKLDWIWIFNPADLPRTWPTQKKRKRKRV